MSEMREMPSEKPSLLREHLLALEPQDPALRAEYERKLNAMLEVPLSETRRTSTAVVLVAAVAMGGLFVTLLLTESIPWKTRGVFAVGLVFAAAWAVYAGRILRRGTFRRKTDSTVAAGLAWTFALITAIAFALLGPQKDPFTIFGFLFLLPAAVILLRTVTEQAEIRTQERLLELEYRLARLGEALQKNAK
jgi:hypothetical protein